MKKAKLTVTLAAKANGDKLKPYIAFPGHKRKVQNLKKGPKIKNRCYVESRMLESLAGCRTMFLFTVSCNIGALERNAY